MICTRKITICLNGWTKKGLTALFLGISCFYDTTIDKTQHAFLNLTELQHLQQQMGEMLAECLKKCLDQWGIREDQVMSIVSDNGFNMVKGIRLLQEVHAAKKSDESESYKFESDKSEHEIDEEEIQSQSEQTDLSLPDHIS